MKVRVIFDCMRHGEKDGDSLTPKGVDQVIASARANLSGRQYVAAFFSGMNRARETAENALGAIAHRVLELKAEPGFGYLWADDPAYPVTDAMERVKALVAEGAEETVELWLNNWGPPPWAIRGRFLGTLEKWALHFANRLVRDLSRGPIHPDMGVPTLHILVGSHSPTSELACLDPSATPRLREADGITYCVEVDTDTLETTLVSSEVWRRPDDV